MPKALEAQRDFSAGEIDVSAKRSDQSAEIAPLLKAGLRQALNMRIRNSKALRNRPGRSALQLANERTDEITILPGLVYRFSFGITGTLKIFDTNGAQVFTQAGYVWNTRALVNKLTFAVIQNKVYICCQSSVQPPTVLTYDGVTPWVSSVYAVLQTASQQVRTPFYRISQLGVTMQPSATSGPVTLVFSADIFPTAAPVNTLMRFCGRQMQITGRTDSHTLSANVIEVLPPSQTLPVDSNANFALGDEVVGQKSGAKGIVIAVPVGTIVVQLINSVTTSTQVAGGGTPGTAQQIGVATFGFVNPEVVASAAGAANINGAPVNGAPQPVTVWDEQVLNGNRGWPRACFADQGRLGFCDIPALPNAIIWSAINAPIDLYTDGQPSSAMMELAPDKVQIFYVLAGPESSEFVFCDLKIYYIPISATNPLTPGRVAFNILSSSGAFQVQPRVIDEDIVYVDSQNTIYSITAPGMYYRPYGVRNLTPVSTHLIKSPIALAVPTQQGTFAEQYIYVLNTDGTIAVGKYETENGQIKGVVGWVPWTGAGTVSWVSARDAQVLFTSVYPGATNVLEALDDTVYLDAAISVNAPPAGLAAPPNKGPLWWIAGQTVDLMDQAVRMMGTYQIDANGFIVPQNNGGENLAAASLVAGQYFQGMVEPFLPAAPPGPDAHQRMTKRRIARLGAHVSRSTGFCFVKIASRIGPLLPPVGTVTIIRRVTAWNQDDDPTLAPPLRETSHNTRPNGRDFDPRVGLMKDSPGPWEILEIGLEAST